MSLCFLIFRLTVKIRSFRRIYTDDCLVILAWAMLLGSAILWQVESPTLYELYAVTSGQKIPDAGFIARQIAFLRTIVPFTILFYSCLWTVKLSFLIFFRRLGANVRGHKAWWWFVLILIVLTWAACVADIHWVCSLGPFETISSR